MCKEKKTGKLQEHHGTASSRLVFVWFDWVCSLSVAPFGRL